MGGLFGGSNSNSSSNQNYGNAVNQLNPIAGQASSAANAIAALLGNGGTAAQQAGFNNFKNSSGYNFDLSQGSQAITGNAAANGLLNSGSTLKALSNYGQNTANNFLNQYLQQQSGLASLGIGAVSAENGAGNTSQGSGKGGLGTSQGSIGQNLVGSFF
jgi:hypothetical protein